LGDVSRNHLRKAGVDPKSSFFFSHQCLDDFQQDADADASFNLAELAGEAQKKFGRGSLPHDPIHLESGEITATVDDAQSHTYQMATDDLLVFLNSEILGGS
jgi:hypothetical protein